MNGASNGRPDQKRTALRIATLATLGIAVVAVAVAVVVTVLNSSSRAVATAESTDASPAPGKIDFQPTHEVGAGRVEGLPADAVHDGDNLDLLAAGSEAPDFALSTAAGTLVRLSSYRGKTVLLEFSTTWCPHCQAEAPHLKQLMASLPVERFAMISVNADSEDAASLIAFDRYFGITFPTLLDPGAAGQLLPPGLLGLGNANLQGRHLPYLLYYQSQGPHRLAGRP